MKILENGPSVSAPVPKVRLTSARGLSLGNTPTGQSLFMLVCCLAMVAGTGILLLSAPAGQSLGQTLLLASPMLGCIALHFVLHRFMAKSCHSQSKQEVQND